MQGLKVHPGRAYLRIKSAVHSAASHGDWESTRRDRLQRHTCMAGPWVLPKQAMVELVGPAAWRRQSEGLRIKAAAEEERAKWQRAAEEQQVQGQQRRYSPPSMRMHAYCAEPLRQRAACMTAGRELTGPFAP